MWHLRAFHSSLLLQSNVRILLLFNKGRLIKLEVTSWILKDRLDLRAIVSFMSFQPQPGFDSFRRGFIVPCLSILLRAQLGVSVSDTNGELFRAGQDLPSLLG
jgi:hypothetical protein